jgi:hypothetical protein
VTPEILSFDDALANSKHYPRRHVLLGNGFSIACRPDIFRYDALLEEATFDGASADLRRVFDIVGTTDFERIILLLRLAADVCDSYGTVDGDLCDRLRHDADVVMESLARVLAARHPDYFFNITDEEYASARQFLSNFNRIYTLNYDMLVYWTVMQDTDHSVARNDGFGNPDDDTAPYVVWQPYVTYDAQRVFYLHGGLHLYDSGPELAKITWSRTSIPLVEQIREALDEHRFPLIVTEGNSDEKLTKILHSAYLNHAIRSFSCIGGALFTFGMSLAPNDDHLLRRVAEGSLRAIFVSLHGDPSSATNQAIIGRAQRLGEHRPVSRPLTVSFFDAESARVWR